MYSHGATWLQAVGSGSLGLMVGLPEVEVAEAHVGQGAAAEESIRAEKCKETCIER